MEQEKHRISVRLNGREQSFTEGNGTDEIEKVVEEIASSDELFEPVERVKPSRPKIIDLGRKRNERRKESFWDDGNRARSPKLPYKRKKKKREKFTFSLPSLPFGLIAATISAIIVGVSFGFMVLTIFTGDAAPPVEHTPVAANGSIEFVNEIGTSNLPELTVEVVQGGAFSSKAKGAEIIQPFQSSGFPAILTSGSEPYYMFIGIGHSRENAREISTLHEERGQETYVKTYQVVPERAVGDEAVASYIKEGTAIFTELLELSGRDSFTKEDVASVEVKWTSWKENDTTIQSLSEAEITALDNFSNSLQSTVQALKKDAESSNENTLWELQQHLLQALEAYEQLVKG